MNVVHEVAEMSMNSAVGKIKQRPDYAQAGEVYISHIDIHNYTRQCTVCVC